VCVCVYVCVCSRAGIAFPLQPAYNTCVYVCTQLCRMCVSVHAKKACWCAKHLLLAWLLWYTLSIISNHSIKLHIFA